MNPLTTAERDESELATPPLNLVKLVSKEGHEFVCDRDCVNASGKIRAMLAGPGVWNSNTNAGMPTLVLESVSTHVLEKIIQYFYYKRKYDHTAPPLPEFKIDIKGVVPLLIAASFLDT
jgi:hypothetical protein